MKLRQSFIWGISLGLLALLGITWLIINQDNPLEQLRETKKCQNCNLAGLDLSREDLKEANLEKANLEGVNLAGA
ncbi:MAG: pentapeptide repeat-containing protein, partial [Moorea sp. SIO4G2]|nr:pentapeptide repeat-containing protein [Moorena sp. SIO4G2]